MRFLVVSYTVPVQASGTAIVIRRLLENFTPDEVVLLARRSGMKQQLDRSALDYPIVEIPIPHGNYRGARYAMIFAVLLGILQGLWTIHRHNLKAIVTFFPDEGALLLGYFLHRITGLPFLPYFCDLYLEANRQDWQKSLAEWLQPRVLAAASPLIVVNAGMQAFFHEQYGLKNSLIPTAINQPIPDFRATTSVKSPMIIGYSGSVTSERLDALLTLVSAIKDDKRYELHYFTAQSQYQLEALGVWTSNARLDFARNSDELLLKLSKCDVLYLPLTFSANLNNVNQLKTAFGIKAYDYFLSQRPILVHSPQGYFTSQFFIDNDCGLVVNQRDTDLLLEALEKLRDDKQLCIHLVKNALKVAEKFEGKRLSDKLRQILEEVV